MRNWSARCFGWASADSSDWWGETQRRHIARNIVAIVAVVLVVVSVGNLANSNGWLDHREYGDLVVTAVVALPSLLNIVVGRSWNGWLWGSGVLLAVGSWVPFLGEAGDLSCTDCALALLWPLYLAPILTLLLVVRIMAYGAKDRSV